MKPVIIIPSLNPDKKLIDLVEVLSVGENPIVIINDGSKIQCQNIFDQLESKYKCEIVTHEINKGKGAAIKSGISYAAIKYPHSLGYITADADGQHAAQDIFKVAHSLEKNNDKLIIGSRNFGGKNVPFKSRWGNRITSVVFLISTGIKCLDTQTGLRGIPASLKELCLSVQGDRFEYEMNMLLEFAKMKIQFVPVAIKTIYLEENKSSHFNAFSDSFRIYFNILKYSLSSLFSSVIDITAFTLFVALLFGKATSGLLAATIFARLISGSINFMLNKHLVFQSKEGHGMEVIKYLTLFVTQMLTSWALVSAISVISLNISLIKILVDSGLFIISYKIQKKYIFNTKRKGTDNYEKFSLKTL